MLEHTLVRQLMLAAAVGLYVLEITVLLRAYLEEDKRHGRR